MNPLLDVLSIVFLIGGAFFFIVGSIGVVRLPDFYSRTHATGKSDTLGLLLLLTGLAIYEWEILESIKLLLIAVFVGIANPTATHALARAAYQLGLKPWFRDAEGHTTKGSEKS
jgi:multicomponent Na+:H+ antiporter subunit G